MSHKKHFPSLEAALLTISFLTFAVFLIKVVQVRHFFLFLLWSILWSRDFRTNGTESRSQNVSFYGGLTKKKSNDLLFFIFWAIHPRYASDERKWCYASYAGKSCQAQTRNRIHELGCKNPTLHKRFSGDYIINYNYCCFKFIIVCSSNIKKK